MKSSTRTLHKPVPTKKLQAEILKVYEAYWDGYLKGDVQGMTSLLAEEYTQVGSAETEVFHTKQGAVKFLRDTIDQIAGKAEMRNRRTRVELLGNLVLVHELCDVYVLDEAQWIFYAKFRASTLMQQLQGKWKIIHQHSSFPDARTAEGENIATEKVSEENQRLREAVHRRTVELEQKNRDLAIETALERVRAVAMSMKQPVDMLEICRAISFELTSLKVKNIRNVQTAIFYQQRGTYMNYEYYAKHKKTVVTETTYTNNRTHNAFAQKMLKGEGEIFTTHIKGKKVKDWVTYQKTTNVFIDKYLNTATSLSYYWYSLGPVAMGISSYSPLSDNDLNLFKRFRNVFELAYRRYLDIEKAEAHAKESRIELSLERVRARSMAMHKSDELVEAADVVFQQLKDLGIDSIRTGIATFDAVKETVTVWSRAHADMPLAKILGVVPKKSHPFFTGCFNAWRAKEKFFSMEFVGNEVVQYYKLMSSILSYPAKKVHNSKEVFYTFFFPEGSVNVVRREKLADDEIAIMLRFAGVFGSMYRRFLDLQKAEAQARENQIQLALERVRARTMGMQHSDELQAAAILLFTQMKALGIHTGSCGFTIWDKTEKSATVWMSSAEGGLQMPFTMPHTVSATYKQAYEAMKKGEDLFVREVRGKHLQKHFDYLSTLPGIGEVITNLRKAGYPFPETIVYHFAFFAKGYLAFHLHEQHPETHDIFKRFAKVFEQTYIRFLDLQKAEAQSREARVETALERIRARAMAMRTSDELENVVHILREQMGLLGQPELETSVITLIEQDADNIHSWYAFRPPKLTSGEILTGSATFPWNASSLTREMMKAYRAGKREHTIEANAEKAMELFHVLVQVMPAIGEFVDDVIPERVWYHLTFFTGGTMLMVSHSAPSEEAKSLQRRAASVFDLAYRRYRDLKKAEAQARESHIQLSLERVRARTMAMHQSHELADVAGIVFNQLTDLGIQHVASGFVIFDRDKPQGSMWMAFQGKVFPKPFEVNYASNPVLSRVYDTWKIGQPFYENKIEGEQFEQHVRLLKTLFGGRIREVIDKIGVKLQTNAMAIPKRMVMHHTFFESGSLVLTNFTSIKEQDILTRFATVFHQAFTRFLDLQKTEAQAREAQIEAALEKVRGKAMAMHNSGDLSATVSAAFSELRKLGIETIRTGVALYSKDQPAPVFYASTTTEKDDALTITGSPNPSSHPCLALQYEAWANQQNYFPKLSGTELESYYHALSLRPFLHNHGDRSFHHDEYGYYLPFSGGNFYAWSLKPCTENEINLLSRFRSIVDLTFRRYFEIQKAEAQAREAKIEVALERARTQSMLMQHSKELDDTLRVFHEQVLLLGINSAFSFLWLPDEDKERHIFWAAWAENNSTVFKSKAINYPLDKNEPATAQCFIDWRSNEPVHSYRIPPDGVENYFAVWKELLGGVEKLKPEYFPGGLYYVEAFMKYGCFGVMIESGLSDDQKKILLRFSIEFERAYTRFLDLQKAEAQAREAQIELSLERIRAKVTAMQESPQLLDIVVSMRNEFVTLGHEAHHFWYMRWLPEKYEKAMTSGDGTRIGMVMELPRHIHGDIKLLDDWEKSEEPAVVYAMDVESAVQYIDKMVKLGDFKQVDPNAPTLDDIRHIGGLTFVMARTTQGEIGYSLPGVVPNPPADDVTTLVRFAGVFDLAYRRFEDLKEAEKRNRETQIELALERVRARTMAMQKSKELKEVIKVVYEQFVHVNVGIDHTGFIIDYKTRDDMHIWLADQHDVPSQVTIPYFDSPHWNSFNEAKKKGENFFANHLTFEEKNDFYTKLFEFFPGLPEETRDFYLRCPGLAISTVLLENVGLYIENFSGTPYTDEENATLMRFGKVFQQTYTRFLDLQKAEAQTREAQVEAALERVRSRTLAMQKSDELADTAAVLFRQLIALGVAPNRLYIAIITHEGGDVEFWITDEDGSKVNSAFAANLLKNRSWKKMYDGWKEKAQSITIDMKGDELEEYFLHLNSLNVPFKDGLSQKRRVQTVAYFSKGFIGIASPVELPEETKTLLGRFAAVLNLTFTRFSDLQRAEAQAHQAHLDLIQLQSEKKRAEDALGELSATQAQLVQQEKLASLGQLTAGIAHEIKNPLNFVNNFSSVSVELIDEVMEEIARKPAEGDSDIPQLLTDVKTNLAKIIEHGTRADGIVKSMLQHSRGSSGKKEPTDLNALVKEYVNLAFHGMRAAKLPINVDIALNLDPSVGVVPLIAGDFSRIVINLCQNAFDAMREKLAGSKSYLPRLAVRTKREDDSISIEVEDNGPGIPDAIKDKILQPFFTTKKGTQGTGLGLSITNEIIKAHGGSLSIESSGTSGTVFKVSIPLSNMQAS